MYNQLPEWLKLQYAVVYDELICDGITMFKNSAAKWGVLAKVKTLGLFSTHKLLLEPIYNSTGYNKDLGLIEAVQYDHDVWDKAKNIYTFFDTKGNQIWQSKPGEQVRTDQYLNVFLDKDGKIGLLDKDFKPLLLPEYEHLSALNEQFYKASKNGLFGIIDKQGKTVLAFEFEAIFNRVERNKVMVKPAGGPYSSFDLNQNTLTKLPFHVILPPSSNTYKAPVAESLNLYKSIILTDEQADVDEYNLEMLRYPGLWGIIDGSGKTLIPNEYCFIDFLRNPNYFKVAVGTMEMADFDDEGQDYRTSIKNVKWGIIDAKHNIVVPIEYDWIDEVESTIWVVYQGGTVFYNDDYQEDYWTIENGKLGVYNLTKLITPIAYDSIQKTWFRIKDYIFVQKGTSYFDENKADYEVFTLDGRKIEQHKPKPRDHQNGY